MINLTENLQALAASANVNSEMYKNSLDYPEDGFKLLEKFPSPHKTEQGAINGIKLALEIRTSEFTSLCPLTGQPDFAEIIINYIPDDWCVESKSLKLYFLSFRNRRDFHESCITAITNDLVNLIDPLFIEVIGKFTPRGGIPFWPKCTYYKNET